MAAFFFATGSPILFWAVNINFVPNIYGKTDVNAFQELGYRWKVGI